jgi:hypothetical protein
MPINNITRINTVDEWRIQTNQSANAINNIETGNFNKTSGTLTISNTGALSITAQGTSLTVANNVLLSNTVTIGRNVELGSREIATGNLTVGANVFIYGVGTALFVANNATVNTNLQVTQNVRTNNIVANVNVTVSGTTQSGNLLVDSIAIITGNTTAGNLTTANATSTGSLRVNDTTETSSNISGAAIIYGGVGVSKSAFISGNVTVKGDAAGAVNNTVLLSLGSLASNSAGNLYIYAANTANGGANGSLTVQGNSNITGNLRLGSGLVSSSKTTGSLIVEGGVGVSANVHATDFIATNSLVADSARITANTTGAHFIASGSLVADNARIAANTTGSHFVASGSLVSDSARITANATANNFVASNSLVADNARITANTTGAHFVASGSLVADNARITANATFSETTAVTINATNARISGNANVSSITATNSIVADNARIAANTTGAHFIASGSLVADNSRVTANATASNFVASNSLVADNARIAANTTGSHFVASGSLVADSARITANTTGAHFVASGSLVADNARITSNLSAGNLYASSVYDNGNRVARTSSGTTPITATLNATTGALSVSHDTSGVVAATHGSSVQIPVFVVEDKGHISSVTNTNIRVATTSVTGIVQLEDSVSSTSTTTAAVPASVRTAVLNGQANVGAARIADTAAAQANTGAGLIIVTNAYQTNVGAARIVDTAAAQANVGSANIAAFANHVKLVSTAQTIDGSLTITGGVTVGGDFTITGQQLVDTNRIKLMATTKQSVGAGFDYITINRVNATAVLDGTRDTINMSGHGFSMGQNVMFTNISPDNVGSPITGLSNNTIYRVLVLDGTGAVAVGGTNANFFRISTAAGYNPASPASSTPINFTNNGRTLTFDQDNKDADIRWNEASRVWEFRDVSNLNDATAYSRALTANALSDSTSLDSSTNIATSRALRTAVLNSQANVGAGDIAVTNAYQVNVGAARIVDTAAAQANVGAGLISVTNAYQVNVGAARIADTATAQANTGAALIAARADIVTANTNLRNYADTTFLPKTGGTISTDLTISGNLTVSGTVTTINTEEINLADNEIVLNSNLPTNTQATQDAGILINRGANTNVYIRWNETGDFWVANNGLSGNEFRLANSTTYLAEGTNLYYTQARFDTAFSGKSTTNLAEGTNLYFTAARVRNNVSASNTSVSTTANTTQPIQYQLATGLFYHANSGVVVGSHGSASQVPVFTVTNTGHITGVTATNIAISSGAVSGLVASATTDTTNASNITAGTLSATRLADVSGLVAATHGNDANVPVFIVDSKGRVTSVTNTAIRAATTSVTGIVSLTDSVSSTSTTTAATPNSVKTAYDLATTASNERLRWDGGSTGLVAATGRTSLGATTIGSNLFILANPGAITFPRFNADNSVSSLNAADFRTAIGAGTSSTTGTVTSVAAGTGLTGGTITSSGTIAANFGSSAGTICEGNDSRLGARFIGTTTAQSSSANQALSGVTALTLVDTEPLITTQGSSAGLAIGTGSGGAPITIQPGRVAGGPLSSSSVAELTLLGATGSAGPSIRGGRIVIRGGNGAGTQGFGGNVAIIGGRGRAGTSSADGGNIYIDGGICTTSLGLSTSNGSIFIGTRDTGSDGDFANTTDVIIGKSGTAVKLPGVGTSGFVKLGAGGILTNDTNTYLTGTKVDSISGSSPINASESTGAVTISLATSGVTAATHGSGTQVPVIVVDTYGRITSVTNTSVSLSTSTDQQLNSLGVGTAASGTTGEIRATGDITSGYSDDKLKDKLGNIENALDKITQIAGFYYQPNDLAKSLGYDDSVQVGVSAQEVQKVLPEVVVPAPIGSQFLTVKYDRMIPLLIEAIKELKSEIEDIKKKI